MPSARSFAAPHLYLLRFSGEVTTKSRGTRRQFQRRLKLNVEDALRSTGLPFRVDPEWARLFVEAPVAAAEAVLPQVFGIQSFSAVERRSWRTLDDLVAAGEALFGGAVAGKTFAVRARRSGDKRLVPFRSLDVERSLGARLLPAAAAVDLAAPQVKVQVEIRPGEAFFFSRQMAGPAGLPLGTEGRALALISGGFDSAVAAWQLLKRGVRLEYLFCNLGGQAHRQGALEVSKLVAERWSHGYRPKLHAVDLQPLVADLKEHTDPKLWQVLLKRLMLRVAAAVAKQRRVEALVTGEAVGQVSSQTLRNLRVIEAVASLPVLRPLVGHNKEEIIALARRVGTHDLSAGNPEYCALHSEAPSTRASLAAVEAEEAKLDSSRLERAIREREVLDLKSLDLETARPELAIDHVPAGARVHDLRSEAAYAAWHYPGAARVDYFGALADPAGFAPTTTHVLYCEVGLKSGHLAEHLRARGVTAFHFAGGLRQLWRWSEREEPALRALRGPVLLSD